jgi:hypothetical protein
MSKKIPLPESERCRFTSTHGRRCCNPLLAGAATGLCAIHQRQFENLNLAEARAISEQILGPSPQMSTKENLQSAMGQLFILATQKRISRRDGILLAYIGSIFLQTFPSANSGEPTRPNIIWDGVFSKDLNPPNTGPAFDRP